MKLKATKHEGFVPDAGTAAYSRTHQPRPHVPRPISERTGERSCDERAPRRQRCQLTAHSCHRGATGHAECTVTVVFVVGRDAYHSFVIASKHEGAVNEG